MKRKPAKKVTPSQRRRALDAARIAKLETVLRLADELCDAIDARERDIGGFRATAEILAELGPAVDAAKPRARTSPTHELVKPFAVPVYIPFHGQRVRFMLGDGRWVTAHTVLASGKLCLEATDSIWCNAPTWNTLNVNLSNRI